MLKKMFATLLCLCLLVCALPAMAQEATALPFGLTFAMGWEEAAAALGDQAQQEPWEEDGGEGVIGSIWLENCDLGIGTLKASYLYLDVNRNNSALQPRLYDIICTLPTGDNAIAAFRDALSQVQAVYGAPDSDPFDPSGVESYVEFGALSASWTKDDVRISLNMQRMYGDSLSLDFANRLCYSADDLK